MHRDVQVSREGGVPVATAVGRVTQGAVTVRTRNYLFVFVKEFHFVLSTIAPCIALPPASVQSCFSEVKTGVYGRILIIKI